MERKGELMVCTTCALKVLYHRTVSSAIDDSTIPVRLTTEDRGVASQI